MEVFYIIDNKENVDIFFKQMSTMQSKERMNQFCKYHTGDVLNKYVNIWNPPTIWEIWNKWNK